jgi:hypothetical protein
MLVVSNPHLVTWTVTAFVETTQVAPTILSLLGLDPGSLQAVAIEGTPVPPDIVTMTTNNERRSPPLALATLSCC